MEGAMPDPDPVVDPPAPVVDPDPVVDPPEGDKPLGESGEKALQAWKDRAKKAEADAKRANDLQAELDAIKAANMSEQEKAIADARKEASDAARTEVLTSVLRDRFSDKLAAVTAGRLVDPDILADPDVAVKLLGLDEIPVTETGQIDAEAISAAVGSFLEKKPHFAASATRPAPLNQGARSRSEQVDPATLTDAKAVREWAEANRRKY